MSSAPVIEYVAPAPAVTLSVPSQLLLPAHTTTTDTTDDNFDTTGLVHPQFSFTAVEVFSLQVVVYLVPSDEFDAPVYSQIHQEQTVAGMTTQHRVENPAVQEEVIVQEIPQAPQVQIVERRQEQIVEPIDVLAPAVTYAAHSQQLPSIIKAVATGVNLDMTGLVNPQFSIAGVEVSAPQAVGSLLPLQEFVAPMCNQVLQEQIVATVQPRVCFQEISEVQVVERIQVSQTTLNTRSTSTSSGVLAATHAATALATTDDDPIPPILDDEQMLHRYQAQIDQCVHMLTTKKDMIERYEKQVAALLERVPRTVFSRDRRVLQKQVDEFKCLFLARASTRANCQGKVGFSHAGGAREARTWCCTKNFVGPEEKTEAQTLTSLLLSDFVQHIFLHFLRREGDC